MLRLALRLAAGLLALALLLAALVLGLAHRSIRRIDPPLPTAREILASGGDAALADLPVRLRWIETATQRMPTHQVLALEDGEADPPFVMSHPSFVLEWADGRLFLVDLGMDADSARAFGAPLEWLAGADPIAPVAATASRLGPAAARVAGIGFTHLHVDHVAGIDALCAARAARPASRALAGIPWFRMRGQAERTNFTTRGGFARLAASPCLEPSPLRDAARGARDGGLAPVSGLAGLGVFEAAGHTPGSQVFVVRLRSGADSELWILAGDVANHARGILDDRSKPLLYQLVVVPESPDRLARVRGLLQGLARSGEARVVVSHDRHALEASGLEQWPAPLAASGVGPPG